MLVNMEIQKHFGYVKCFIVVFCLFSFVSCEQAEKKTDKSVNPTIETILSRKSVRKYTQRPVEKERLELLVRAGMAAPSSRDRRPWEFVVVTDRALLDKLGDGLPLARMLKETNQAIIVCGDTVKSSNSWFLDCSAAAQNILLAAESMGLGAVWTAAYPYQERVDVIKEVVGLPERIIPLTVIPIGYPTGVEKTKDKYNPQQVHYNGW